MKRGFTLVELSIVLVIIGLLIGGILVARSMIDTARTQTFVRQLQQFEIAINNFKVNYKVYPGDSGYFSPRGAPDGQLYWGDTDGDGALNVAGCNGLLSNNETTQFWAHLSQAKMIKDTYPSYSPASCGGTHTTQDFDTGTIAPYMKVSKEIDTMISGYGTNKIAYVMYKPDKSANLYTGLFFSPMDGMALVSKMGVQTIDSSNQQSGLTTGMFSVNKCGDIDFNEVDCGAASAVLMDLVYYFPPNN